MVVGMTEEMTPEVRRALDAALAAEAHRQECQRVADQAALHRAVAVTELVRVAGGQSAAARLLGTAQPNISVLVRKAQAASAS